MTEAGAVIKYATPPKIKGEVNNQGNQQKFKKVVDSSDSDSSLSDSELS